jgi:hypothetical protein
VGLGGEEGRVPSLMAAAVESEVLIIISFLSSLMCRPWGIRLQRGRNEVCVNPKGISPWVTREIRIGNFSFDGSSHQTGDAAFTPATPHDLHHSRANNDSHNFALRKRTLSTARHVLEDTLHQIRPKIDAGDASLLMGSIN